MAQTSRRRLCIDFGTSNTAASYRVGGDEPVIVPLGPHGPMPSAVFASESSIVVGHDAVVRRLQAPDAFEDTPKSRIDDREIELGDRFWPIEDLIGAVLRHVHQMALRHSGVPAFDAVILTHPDRWTQRRKDVLRRAAERAGIRSDRLRIASESLAAAWFYVHHGHDVNADERMCVFDFGAGTCDVAVLVHDDAGGFTVTGSGGDNNLGGRDLDARMIRWVLDEAGELDPDLPRLLRAPGAAISLADNVRAAKEILSDTAQAVIDLPGTGRTLLLTRREFESIIEPYVERAVELTRDVVARADGRGPVIVYVTGGGSSIPMLQSALASVGRVARIGDPKVVVAQGGLLRSTNVVPGVDTGTTAIGGGAACRVTCPSVPSCSVVTAVLVRSGQPVGAGEPLVTVDSASGPMTLGAPVSGVVHAPDLRPGMALYEGAVFGAIGPAGLSTEDWSQLHRKPATLNPTAAARAPGPGVAAVHHAPPRGPMPQVYAPPVHAEPYAAGPTPRMQPGPGAPGQGHPVRGHNDQVNPRPVNPRPVNRGQMNPGQVNPGQVNAWGLAGVIVGVLGFPVLLGTIVGLVLTVIGIRRAGRREALTTAALAVNILGIVAWIAIVVVVVVTG